MLVRTDCTDHGVSTARYSTKAADQQHGCWCLLLGLEEGESGRWRVRWSRASARWRSSGRPGQGTAADTAARLHRAAPFSRHVRSCILAAPAHISGAVLHDPGGTHVLCWPDLDMHTSPIINTRAGLCRTCLLCKLSCQAVCSVQTMQTFNTTIRQGLNIMHTKLIEINCLALTIHCKSKMNQHKVDERSTCGHAQGACRGRAVQPVGQRDPIQGSGTQGTCVKGSVRLPVQVRQPPTPSRGC